MPEARKKTAFRRYVMPVRGKAVFVIWGKVNNTIKYNTIGK